MKLRTEEVGLKIAQFSTQASSLNISVEIASSTAM